MDLIFKNFTIDLKRYSFLSLCILLIITLPLDNIMPNNIVIMLFGLFTFTDKAFYLSLKEIPKYKLLVYLASYYLIQVVTVSYSGEFLLAIKIIERQLGFILFPIFFLQGANYLTKTSYQQILQIFSFYITLLLIASLINVYYNHPIENLESFKRLALVEFLGIHPTYFAIYMIVGILGLLFTHTKSLYLIIIKYFTALFLLFGIFLTDARMPILAILILIPFYISYWLLKKYNKIIFAGFLLIFIILAGFLSKKIFQNSSRFREISETKFAPPVGIHHNSTNLRVGIFMCTKEVIQNNFWIGVGIGNEQKSLNACYKSKPWSEVLYKLSYNAHCQYLQTFLTMGVLGMIITFVLFVSLIQNGIKNQEIIVSLFGLFFLIISLTESVFCTQKGVVFFTFFFCLFVSKHRINQN